MAFLFTRADIRGIVRFAIGTGTRADLYALAGPKPRVTPMLNGRPPPANSKSLTVNGTGGSPIPVNIFIGLQLIRLNIAIGEWWHWLALQLPETSVLGHLQTGFTFF